MWFFKNRIYSKKLISMDEADEKFWKVCINLGLRILILSMRIQIRIQHLKLDPVSVA